MLTRPFFQGAQLVALLLFYTVMSSMVYSQEKQKSSVLLMLECSWMRKSRYIYLEVIISTHLLINGSFWVGFISNGSNNRHLESVGIKSWFHCEVKLELSRLSITRRGEGDKRTMQIVNRFLV